MATVLSRALKLPGKKSPDLGEYDPLTQADSDESEDDLVLNIQKNGGVKNGKSPPEEVQDPDSDVEVGMTKQHTSESAPEGYPAEAAGSLEQKAAPSLMPYLRTAVFLLTVVISMILVLVCAFLIPCPPRDLHNTWNRNLGQGAGGVLSPLELCDVNGDGLPDILIVFTALMNASVMGVSRPSVTVMALSGMNGSNLWSIHLPEETLSVQCKGLLLGAPAEPVCLVTGTSKLLSLLSASTGNVQAVALRDIFTQARNRDSFPAMLQQEEPEWEKRRSVNLSELIDIYSGGVYFLQTMKASDTNCSNLLITTKDGLILLRGQDLEPHWILEMQNISSQPVPGYFGTDKTLDFMLQAQTGDGKKKVVVIDGKSGLPVWNQEFPWQKQDLDALSVMTLDKKSVFLFWADEAQSVLQSLQPGPRTEHPGLHHLYLLHPVFPTVLLDLTNATDKVIASAVGINDLQKDAFYITVTTTATSEKQPGFFSVSKLGLKWAMMTQGRMVWLKDNTTPKISRGEVRRFLARLKFVDFPHKL
ncbi:protein FAM234B isoform X3 [Apteryx mantelli]|uniref:Protein FAM234B isoform X3 n=1 Tax=Apteryx mantelli TaxID=2696672 RepID=A0ABM4FQU5_9AVES